MRDDFRFAWRILTRFKLYAVAAVTVGRVVVLDSDR